MLQEQAAESVHYLLQYVKMYGSHGFMWLADSRLPNQYAIYFDKLYKVMILCGVPMQVNKREFKVCFIVIYWEYFAPQLIITHGFTIFCQMKVSPLYKTDILVEHLRIFCRKIP